MTRTRERAADVVNDLTDEHLPDHAEKALLADDGVLHLAAAYKQIAYADASGVSLSELDGPYDDVERALRERCVDILRERSDGAPDATRYEQIIAEIQHTEWNA